MLPDGLHQCTIEEIQAQCVDAFPHSNSRPQLFTGLRALVQVLSTDGIPADLWIDGSFVTMKLHPGDIDVLLYVSADTALTNTQEARLAWLIDPGHAAQIRHDYGCDFYFMGVRDILEPYWRRQYGTDRSGNSKGIVVLSISGGAA